MMTNFGAALLVAFAIWLPFGALDLAMHNAYNAAKSCMREAVENGVSAKNAYYRCER